MLLVTFLHFIAFNEKKKRVYRHVLICLLRYFLLWYEKKYKILHKILFSFLTITTMGMYERKYMNLLNSQSKWCLVFLHLFDKMHMNVIHDKDLWHFIRTISIRVDIIWSSSDEWKWRGKVLLVYPNETKVLRNWTWLTRFVIRWIHS